MTHWLQQQDTLQGTNISRKWSNEIYYRTSTDMIFHEVSWKSDKHIRNWDTEVKNAACATCLPFRHDFKQCVSTDCNEVHLHCTTYTELKRYALPWLPWKDWNKKIKIIKITAFIINIWKTLNQFSSYKIPDAKEKCIKQNITKLQNTLVTSQKNGTDNHCRNNNKSHKDTVLFIGFIVHTCTSIYKQIHLQEG
jgi:hypothetical protein